MNYNNPENLPIVGEEDSHSKLKNEIKEEGQKAFEAECHGYESDCPYKKGSTFHDWWTEGYGDCKDSLSL